VELELAGNQAMHPLLAATMVKMVKDNGFKRLSFLCGVFFFFFLSFFLSLSCINDVAPIDVALILGS
jgi:hypothetical protein